MLPAERLMAGRALTLIPPALKKRDLYIVSNDQDDRDTLPPSPMTEPPPSMTMPSDALKRMQDYDDNQFLHVALTAAADAAHELREWRKGSDIKALLDKQTERILKETSADYGSLRSSITGLQQSVDALVTRIGNTEKALDNGTRRFEALELDMVAMRSQMDRLDRELAILRGIQDATAGTTPQKG